MSDVGYVEAFYKLGALMGIEAQDRSPSEVWKTDMLPRLRLAFDYKGEGLVGVTIERGRTVVAEFSSPQDGFRLFNLLQDIMLK